MGTLHSTNHPAAVRLDNFGNVCMTDLNGWLWIAGIAAFFLICVWLVIRASMQIERQDERTGRRDLDEGGNVFDPTSGPPPG